MIFIPICFFHFALAFLKKTHNRRRILTIGYYLSFIFLILTWTTKLIVKDMAPKVSFRYYTVPGPLNVLALLMFAYFVIYAHYELFSEYRASSGLKRKQLGYILLGTVIGFIGGSTSFLPVFNISIFPFGNYFVALYAFIIAYAILKFHLMDINIVLTRAGIFLVVYTLVLGTPFWLGFTTGLWMYSTFLMALLATTGPFIYQYLTRRAEEIILKDQRRYQRALKELAKTMTRIRDLNKLLKAIVLTVVDTVRVSFAGIYLKDEENKVYRIVVICH